jgi:hypothetical protein
MPEKSNNPPLYRDTLEGPESPESEPTRARQESLLSENYERTRQESRTLSESRESEYSITEKVLPLSGKNRINLTEKERTEIALESRLLGTPRSELAQNYNVTTQSITNIKRGKIQGINESKIEEVTNKIKDKALERLMHSLGLLTDDKLSGCSAKDLSVIASNMGRVVEKISPKNEVPDNINFIIYSPELRQERSFKTIEI